MKNRTGYIGLLRQGQIDKQVDLLDRDPISMRTYMSLIVESLNKKKDVIFGLVIPAECVMDVQADDNIPVEVACKGAVYLAESINLHRFSVSTSNPNVISVSKKKVVDPNMKCAIKTIYYYVLKYRRLDTLLECDEKEIVKKLYRLLEDSPTAVSELAQMNSVVLLCHWIGTENDYLNNSVFHMYLEQNKIFGYVFDAKLLSEREVTKERVIFRDILFITGCLICLSLIIRQVLSEITVFIGVIHGLISVACVLLWVINESI